MFHVRSSVLFHQQEPQKYSLAFANEHAVLTDENWTNLRHSFSAMRKVLLEI